MAPSTRFERVAFRLGGERSILLSYEGLCKRHFTALYSLCQESFKKIKNRACFLISLVVLYLSYNEMRL